jgi:hypothetical protein
MKRVSPSDFLSDKTYVNGFAGHMFPKLAESFVDFFNGDYSLGLITGAVGTGKNSFIRLVALRMLYELATMDENERIRLKLNPARAIWLPFFIKDREMFDMHFNAIRSLLERTEYFGEFVKSDPLRKKIYIPKLNVEIAFDPTEKDIYCRELFSSQIYAAFIIDNDGEGYWSNGVYTMLGSKVVRSTFLVSWSRYVEGLTNTLFQRDDLEAFRRKFAVWDTRDMFNNWFDDGFFYAVYDKDTGVGRVDLHPGKLLENEKEIRVPIAFYEDFSRDFENSLFDIAGVIVPRKRG